MADSHFRPMLKPGKRLLFFILSSSFLVFTSCSPKIKIGIWAKSNNDAATALETWVANNPLDAAALLNLDCNNPKDFKKKINDALSSASTNQQPSQQGGYDVRQHNYHYGNPQPREAPSDGFADWCRKYPKAAKRLRSHAKALCKAGIGVLSTRLLQF